MIAVNLDRRIRARAIIRVEWKNGDEHVFFAKRSGKQIIYLDPEIVNTGKTNLKRDIQAYFNIWGDNSRAIVRVRWDENHGHGYHGFIAKRVGEKIIYLDPQSNKIRDIQDTLNICDDNAHFWIMRINAREFSDLIEYAVQNVGL